MTDPFSEVREWIARHASNLDNRDASYSEGETTYEHPERDLAEVLKADPDPFVRAALRENPEVMDFRYGLSSQAEEEFLSCTKMERLAFVRNPHVPFTLIKKILDLDDADLELSETEREGLAIACVLNRDVIQNSHRSRGLDFADGYHWYTAVSRAETIWKLVAKWPEGPLQHVTYKYVQTHDDVKAEVYANTNSTHLRGMILEGCTPSDCKTLGMNPKNETRN